MRTRKSIRKKNIDYSAKGWYFVTICTKDRECFFGNIQNDELSPKSIGEKAIQFWMEIPEHFPMVELAEFIVMPNHIHGIIGITVEISHGVADNNNKFSKSIPGSLSVIIGQFKSSLTRWCKKNEFHKFAWQSRFHDHIIRNDESFQRISEYIINNPAKWDDDKFYIR